MSEPQDTEKTEDSRAYSQAPRRTSADEVFYQLHADIVDMRLPPGTKLSESDVAKQSEVSRQPVREAFIRLNNMGLLTVRPQRATLVRKISDSEILNANFIRTAVEVEVVRRACAQTANIDFQKFEQNIAEQRDAANADDPATFHTLDYDFHLLICIAGASKFAFATIAENKSQADRLGTLCLADKKNMIELSDDHNEIIKAIQNRDERQAIELTRSHLSRLKVTLKNAREEYGEFFED